MTKPSRPASHLSRRRFLAAGAALGVGTIAAPYVARAEEPTLRITGWGGKWGDIMKSEVGPAFESEFKCKLLTDTALPFLPRPGIPDDVRNALRQGTDGSRCGLCGARETQADQARRFHRRDGKAVPVWRSRPRRDPRF